MELNDYLKHLTAQSRETAEDFARRCDITYGHLKQVALGNRRAGENLAINIERESGGLIRCEDLRPDVDWQYLRSSGVV